MKNKDKEIHTLHRIGKCVEANKNKNMPQGIGKILLKSYELQGMQKRHKIIRTRFDWGILTSYRLIQFTSNM